MFPTCARVAAACSGSLFARSGAANALLALPWSASRASDRSREQLVMARGLLAPIVNSCWGRSRLEGAEGLEDLVAMKCSLRHDPGVTRCEQRALAVDFE